MNALTNSRITISVYLFLAWYILNGLLAFFPTPRTSEPKIDGNLYKFEALEVE